MSLRQRMTFIFVYTIMIKKFLLAVLSGVFGLFGAVFALSGATLDISPVISLKTTNLPIGFSGDLMLDLALDVHQISQSGQQFQLSFSECGSGDTEVFYQNEKKSALISTFPLTNNESKSFTLTIKKSTLAPCQLDFFLKEENTLKKIAQTSIALNPSCTAPIDIDEEHILSKNPTDTENQNLILSWVLTHEEVKYSSKKEKKLDSELQSAFDRAVKKGFLIDTPETRKKFQDPMTRLELAQMLNQISDHLNLEPLMEKKCEFTDLSWTPESTKRSAQNVCQLNLMGIHPNQSALENFMPDQLVDRAQMITVISRLLRGDTFNQGTTFYEKHLEKITSEQLITQANPDMIEIQGYFYLILQRAEAKFPLKRESVEETRTKKNWFFSFF